MIGCRTCRLAKGQMQNKKQRIKRTRRTFFHRSLKGRTTFSSVRKKKISERMERTSHHWASEFTALVMCDWWISSFCCAFSLLSSRASSSAKRSLAFSSSVSSSWIATLNEGNCISKGRRKLEHRVWTPWVF